MLEIVGVEAIGGFGWPSALSVRFAGRLSARGPGQRGFVWREKPVPFVGQGNRGIVRGSKRAPQGDPSGICALGTLAEGFQPTRLETRTKESNMYASRWVENP